LILRRDKLTTVRKTRIDNFVCPACGEVIRQVVAVDGVVKGWCPTAKKKIQVVVETVEAQIADPVNNVPLSYLEDLKQKREKVLKDMVSAKEDGDIKENTAFLEAREQLTILDYKIKMEEESLRKSQQNK
jgi:hypothetical protein